MHAERISVAGRQSTTSQVAAFAASEISVMTPVSEIIPFIFQLPADPPTHQSVPSA